MAAQSRYSRDIQTRRCWPTLRYFFTFESSLIMPTCDAYFKELADCIFASDCFKNGTKPSECLELLLKSKAQDVADREEVGDRKLSGIDNVNIIAPKECKLKHQTYAECKVSLMNPRSRLRNSYGQNSGS